MERVGTTKNSGQCLDRCAHNVIFGLLSRQRDPSSLCMATHHPRARIFGPIAFAHKFSPQTPTGAELGNLLKEVIMHIKEEGQARRKFIDLEPAFKSCFDIGQTIGKRKGQLLHSRSPSLAYMVAANTDRVPPGHIARAELDCIDHQAHRWLRREKKLLLCAILLQYIVL